GDVGDQEQLPEAPEEVSFTQLGELLGGQRVLGDRALESSLHLHDLMVEGFPISALAQFGRHFPLVANDPALARVLGMVSETRKASEGPRASRLSCYESSQLWCLAKVLARAAAVFGGSRAAE